VEEIIAGIDKVTVGDVKRVAAEMLAPDRLRFAIIGPDPEPAAQHFMDNVMHKEKSH
jgi:predicted Zn-dependent peptidase